MKYANIFPMGECTRDTALHEVQVDGRATPGTRCNRNKAMHSNTAHTAALRHPGIPLQLSSASSILYHL